MGIRSCSVTIKINAIMLRKLSLVYGFCLQEVSLAGVPGALRPVKSCESLASDTDTLPPLNDAPGVPLKHHTRFYSLFCQKFKTKIKDISLSKESV